MGKNKCNSCGAKVIEYPIWEGQEFGEPFAFSKIKWRNLLIGDWTKLLIMLALAFAVWSYAHDTEECREILENPCDFVGVNQQACGEIKRKGISLSEGNFLDPLETPIFD